MNKLSNLSSKALWYIGVVLFLSGSSVFAQDGKGPQNTIDYTKPKEYEIGGITVSGTKHLDRNVLSLLSGMSAGEKVQVPGDKMAKCIENLWKQGLFSDVRLNVSKIQGNLIFFDIVLTERPRLSSFSFSGIKKSDADDIRDKIKLIKGKVVTDNLIMSTRNTIKEFYYDKGYMNCNVQIKEVADSTLPNSVMLKILIKKGKKVKIKTINIEGNSIVADSKLKRAMKDTKEKFFFEPLRYPWPMYKEIGRSLVKNDFQIAKDAVAKEWDETVRFNLFKASKFLQKKYDDDKEKLLVKYASMGFRDARIISDSVYRSEDNAVNIDIKMYEGNKYYFRNINWVGNTKYSSDDLNKVLGIKKGDVYNQAELDSRLFMNQQSSDVSSLYLDDGYLFFSVTPTEVLVENDSIDIEMRVYEGKQATINKVTVRGNDKTNDHVIIRELRTKPGMLFSRSDIIRSQRELSQLGYFDPEKISVNPKPNPQDGTVDIEYVVQEKPNDQVNLSGGWGAGRIVGTVGLTFNNFSIKNIGKKSAWRPLPTGDGQKLSIQAQSNGIYFQSYNLSFTEPWFGGRNPNSLTLSGFFSVQSNGLKSSDPLRQSISIGGATIGFGKRLKWPDDYFTSFVELIYQNYSLKNYTQLPQLEFKDGTANQTSLRITFSRNSVDAPIYPKQGMNISISGQFTPPISLITNKDYTDASGQDKYRWLEFHKYKFKFAGYQRIVDKLVIATRIHMGMIGLYNRQLGIVPFERFYLGGDGLSGYSLDGREIIALRGYSNNSLIPYDPKLGSIGGTIYNKFTMELRYPVSLNPSATIFGYGFLEAGKAWAKWDGYNPFDVNRSAGFGVKVFLPMFGLLGVDWGYGFDKVSSDPGNKSLYGSHFHFSIGMNFEQ